MKIKIERILNTYNYGSLMMAVVTIAHIGYQFDEVEFFVDCQTLTDVERLKKETGFENIQLTYKLETSSGNTKLRKIVKHFKNAKVEGELYDVKIVLGGDDISEYYGKHRWNVGLPLIFVKSRFLPTILLGQTIGPFTSYRRWLARLALNKTRIYTRDDKTLAYINSLGIHTGSAGRDLAFLDLPMQTEANDILRKYGLEKEDSYITVVPSGLTSAYTSNYDDYLHEQHKIIRNLLDNSRLDGKLVVLLAHVRAPGTSDRFVIEDLTKGFSEHERSRIVVVKEDILASEARSILGYGLFTITGRMHAAISTFFMRKPAISLSYSVKYEGVIGDGLDLSDLVIEAADASLWKNGEISQMVAGKTNYVLDNYQELVTKIDRNVSKTSQIVRIQLDSVVDDIRAVAEKSH